MTFFKNFFLVASVIFVCFISCDSQMRFSSPCPNYFEYQQDSSGNVVGYIRISPGRYLEEITTTIQYSLAVNPPSSFLGSLKPVTTLQDYNNGQTLQYKVIFPVSNPVPEVTQIDINGQVVCRANPRHEVTSITQTHKMKVTKTYSVQSTFGNNPSPDFPDININDFPSNSFSSGFPSNTFTGNTFSSGDTTRDQISSVLSQFNGGQGLPSDITSLLNNFGQDGNTNTEFFINGERVNTQSQFPQSTFPERVPNRNTDPFPSIRPMRYNVTWRPQQTEQPYIPPQTTAPPPPPRPTNPPPRRTNPPPRATNPPPRATNPPPRATNPPPRQTQRPRPTIPPTPAPTSPPRTYPPTTEVAATPQPSTPFPKDCGLRGDASVALIYYGDGYTRGDWPWLVAMYRKVGVGTVFTCAGALVTSIHVVTAAHCMRNQHSTFAQKDIFLKIGAYNLDDWSDRFLETRSLSSALIHDDFDTTTLANDILVMTLDREVQFNQFIRPVCLWKGSSNIEEIIGKRGYVAGWGKSELGGPGVGEPRVLRLPIVSTSTCRGARPDFFKLTSEKTLCAGDRNGSGPCKGDSGGGLYIHREGRWQLRGIVSLSLPDNTGQERLCNPDEYAVFTDVAQYMPWVINAIASYYLK